MKVWWKSKTKWFNMVMGVLALLMMPDVAAVLPEAWLKWVALVSAIGNFYLRSITNTGVSLK